MTWKEAEQEMINGKKITHMYFSSNEWMKLSPDKTKYEFEDGVTCSPRQFWADRQQPFFQNDWSLFVE
jgi:hypothetical protein